MPHVLRVGHRSSCLSARPHTPNPDRRTPLCGQTRLARLFPGLLSAVWPESNARAIPTAQGLGLIPQLLWVARFSPDRHFTPHATHPAPHTPPQPQPQPHLTHPASTPGVWYTIRGCLNQPRRSRVDLNLTPTESPLMRSLMAHVCLAHGRGSVDVLCLSAHSPTPKPCRAVIHPLASPDPDPASFAHRRARGFATTSGDGDDAELQAAAKVRRALPPCLPALGPHTARGLASSEECSSWNYRQNTIAERTQLAPV